jgi:UDP-3-O-[3-hydroxymyristoyl] glucosamine N-acyltransferase
LNAQPRRLGDLAEFVGGRIVGDAEILISGVASIDTARRGDITFAVDEKFLDDAHQSQAACIIVPPHVLECEKSLMQVDNPRFAFAKIASLYAPPPRGPVGVHPSAVIAASARIGREVSVGPHVVIEENADIGDHAVLFAGASVGRDCRIGAGTIIHPNVTIEQDSVIGAHCIIHAGTVVGSDGFGFVQHQGKHFKIPQIGNVVIEDNVEIGSNCTIDRGASGSTVIRSGTKMDNLVHIAHNVQIGHDCLIVAQVGISGSVTVGDSVTLAGQVGVAGHLSIGDRTVVAAKSGVTKTIPGGLHVSGFPAKPHLDEKKIMISLPRLPDAIKKITQLTTAVQRLARRIDKIEGGRG